MLSDLLRLSVLSAKIGSVLMQCPREVGLYEGVSICKVRPFRDQQLTQDKATIFLEGEEVLQMKLHR